MPLLPPDTAPKPARSLNSEFDIHGQPNLMLTQFIAAVPVKTLREALLCLDARSDDIMRALDMLLIGFCSSQRHPADSQVRALNPPCPARSP